MYPRPIRRATTSRPTTQAPEADRAAGDRATTQPMEPSDPSSDASSLSGRRVVLGVSGGIAAYKAIELCRLLMHAGAHVSPVLTVAAQRFVGAATFSALASEPTRTRLFSDADPSPHTRLGQSADLVIVAPATARTLAAYVTGSSANLLIATLLATRAPVIVCPAMHTEMWEHPAVVDNVATLRRRGVVIVDPDVGPLAGGDVGAGRLASPATILSAAQRVLAESHVSGAGRRGDLAGRRVVVSAGGTRELIDPVRFIGNRSSGKQGHAIADAALARGARVVLVTTSALPSHPAIDRVQVETAEQMRTAVVEAAGSADVVVMAAAVADFRPRVIADHKLKKRDGIPEIVLEPTPDILAEVGRNRREGQVIVGFAAETDDVVANAADKLKRKGADLLVANDVARPDAGFEVDTNQVVVLSRSGIVGEFPLAGKRVVADMILDLVIERFGEGGFPPTTAAGADPSYESTSPRGPHPVVQETE